MAARALETQKSSSTSSASSSSASSSSSLVEAAAVHVDFQTDEPRKEIVVAHWDPDLYRSRLWPLTCLFGMSFGALHLVSWNDVFPTTVELWLWRIAAFVSMGSMLVFMHFEKVVLRWEGMVTIVSLSSPAVYLLSRMVMMGEVFAALRAEEPAIYDTYEVSSYWVHLL
ncbi:hypothetical protein BO99DRAFT_433968 [Aspergillus violaceofuscus CBS 115571]|uniref:Uncharacterized protein n=1 Tax=Aspergillus violaceofuscus (strain CBS 115571) TaxID=1450538 RepID=A0A2V5H1Z0_ASPV1|nr:hypothetical protein BO99DRAFT_433968 [Aspergillus violaceofuscus CBS 115571]